MTNEHINVIFCVDTPADIHHVALIAACGKRLGDLKFPAVRAGYRESAACLTSHGPVSAVGVEGTGSCGAKLARALTGEGFTVREVDRASRVARRTHLRPGGNSCEMPRFGP